MTPEPHRNGTLRAAATDDRVEVPPAPPGPAATGMQAILARYLKTLQGIRRRMLWTGVGLIAWAAAMAWAIPSEHWFSMALCLAAGVLGGFNLGYRRGLAGIAEAMRWGIGQEARRARKEEER